MNKYSKNNDASALPPLGDVRPIAEIEIGPAKHEQFLDRNHKKIIVIVLALGVLVGSGIVYNGVIKDKNHKAGAELVAAFEKDGKLNSEKLNNVLTQYPSTKAAVTASYMKAQALWAQGKENEGNQQMLAFIQTAPTEEFRAQASFILGCHYMSVGKNEEASKQFEAVLNSGSSIYTPVAYLSLGDLAQAKGDSEAAGRYYAELSEKFPDSSFVTQPFGVPSREDLLDVDNPTKILPAQKSLTPSAPSTNDGVSDATLGLPSGK